MKAMIIFSVVALLLLFAACTTNTTNPVTVQKTSVVYLTSPESTFTYIAGEFFIDTGIIDFEKYQLLGEIDLLVYNKTMMDTAWSFSTYNHIAKNTPRTTRDWPWILYVDAFYTTAAPDTIYSKVIAYRIPAIER